MQFLWIASTLLWSSCLMEALSKFTYIAATSLCGLKPSLKIAQAAGDAFFLLDDNNYDIKRALLQIIGNYWASIRYNVYCM